jgi:hypothetical protein
LRIGINIEMSALQIGLDRSGPEFSKQNKKLLWLLEALIKCNLIYLNGHLDTPLLYDSGVLYHREPRGEEEWQDIPTCLNVLRGDCEDLAAWRAAELRQQNIYAKAHLKWFHNREVNLTLFHVQVKLPDGTIDDPSKVLGMKGAE